MNGRATDGSNHTGGNARTPQDPPDTAEGTAAGWGPGELEFTLETFGDSRMIRVTVPPGTVPPGTEPPAGDGATLRVWGTLDDAAGRMTAELVETAGILTALMCGGREFQGWSAVERVLDRISPERIIHGAARGADSLAGRYARENRVECRAFPANWRPQGPRGPIDRGAGHERNQKMLDVGRPDIVLAMPGGSGTRDMVRRAREQGFHVQIYDHSGARRYGNPEVVWDGRR